MITKPTDNWPFFKVFPKGYLTGGIREQLTPAERSVWVDLLAKASESRIRGTICRSRGIAYTRETLATEFKVQLEVLNSTIEKCCLDRNDPESDNPDAFRIMVDSDGCLVVGNWEKYQYYNGTQRKRLRETSEERALREERIALRWNREHPDRAGFNVSKIVYVNQGTGEVIREELRPE